MIPLSRALVLIAMVASAANPSAQAADAWAGTWKLNLARSMYALGAAPKSAISRLDPSPDGWKLSQDVVDAKGTPAHLEATVQFDGKDYPVAGAGTTTWAFTKINDHIYDLVGKRDGRVTGTTRTVVSADGKTRTSTTTVPGQTARNVAVYERE